MPQNPVETTLFVSQIKAGTNVSLTPAGGTGVVEVSVPNGAGGIASIAAGNGITVSTTSGVATIGAVTPATRYLPLTDVHADNGLPLLTATAATTIPGIARTAGTSLYLTGAASNGVTPATTKMLWEFDLPSTYVAGAAIPVVIDCVVPTATDVTAASTTMTVNAYSESAAGVETLLTVSAAQQIPLTTAGALTFSITGTGLVPGERVALELVALVTTTIGGASSVQVNSVGYQA